MGKTSVDDTTLRVLTPVKMASNAMNILVNNISNLKGEIHLNLNDMRNKS